MKFQCNKCCKTHGGEGYTFQLDGLQGPYCLNCFYEVKKEYSKKSCEDCVYFSESLCELTKKKLVPTTFAFDEYFLQRIKCAYFQSESDALNVDASMLKIKNLEMAGRYEDAAQVFEKLGMLKEAGETRKKAKDITVLHIDVNALVKQLAERGQTLTYYCCNCGAPLKVGAKNDAHKTCPHCGYDLAVIDIAKFINSHL